MREAELTELPPPIRSTVTGGYPRFRKKSFQKLEQEKAKLESSFT